MRLLRTVAQITALELLLAAVATDATAQEQPPAERNGALKVFLDCSRCDETYLRTEITFINYVRDRTVADVHVLVTTQATGGGGVEYTIRYIGLQRFKGVDQTLTYMAPQTSTPDETRRGFAATLRLGLVRYAAETPLASRIRVSFDAPPGSAPAAEVDDPWNFWVFRLSAGGNLQDEESTSERAFSSSFSANRTTERWKINLNGFGEYEREKFDLEEGETFTAISKHLQARAIVVKSLDERWSLGGTAIALSSTFQNYELRARFAPGVEYNFFPYSDSTHRLLTLFYTVGLQSASYREETIYARMSETLVDHQFEASLALRQPWGTASASAEVQQYLNEADKYRITAFGNLDIRLFKGFSVDVFGRASRRRDQLSLRRGDATTEEILVRQRELATGYQVEIGFGVSYSFGSIFNNVVNPRFRNVGGL